MKKEKLVSLKDLSKLIKPTRNKFGAVRTEYNGRSYHSKKEADYAKRLDLLRKANGKEKVISWSPQVSFSLDIVDNHICKYIVDFIVKYEDRIEYIDVKGYRKGSSYSLFKMKKKLMLACHEINIIEV